MTRSVDVLALAVCAALLSCDSSAGPRCTIVTDGTREVFVHERAHCLGWQHPEFEEASPPPEYIRDYPGRLTVIQCGGWRRHKAPRGTVFVKGCKSALRQCRKMWEERGYDMAVGKASGNWAYVTGCQFNE